MGELINEYCRLLIITSIIIMSKSAYYNDVSCILSVLCISFVISVAVFHCKKSKVKTVPEWRKDQKKHKTLFEMLNNSTSK